MHPVSLFLDFIANIRIFKSLWFWIISIVIVGILGLEDLAKFLGMEQEFKPIIEQINRYLNVRDIIKQAKDMLKSIPLPEVPKNIPEDLQKRLDES